MVEKSSGAGGGVSEGGTVGSRVTVGDRTTVGVGAGVFEGALVGAAAGADAAGGCSVTGIGSLTAEQAARRTGRMASKRTKFLSEVKNLRIMGHFFGAGKVTLAVIFHNRRGSESWILMVTT